MSQDHLIKLKNKETGEVYETFKNRKQNPEKMTLVKFSRKLQKRVKFTEAKK